MRIKALISIFIFLLGLVLGRIYLERVFTTKNYFNNTLSSFEEMEDPIDIMFFGSSHSFSAFNPLIIDQYAGTNSFNFGSDGLSVPFTTAIVKKVLKTQHPRLIVVEVYPTSVHGPRNEESKGYQLRVIDKTSHFDKDKWDKIGRYYSKDELFGVFSKLYRNHSKWSDLSFTDLNRLENIETSSTYFYKGYRGRNIELDTTRHDDFRHFREIEGYKKTNQVWIDSQAVEDLNQLINLAKSKGSAVLLVSAPDLRAKYFWNTRFINSLNSIAAQNNIQYLNLNDYYEQMDLFWTDFRDPSHLNLRGARKASIFISDYIKKNYAFPTRTEYLTKIDNDKKYKKFISDYIEVEDAYYSSEVRQDFKEGISLDSLSIIKTGKNYAVNLYFDPQTITKSDADQYKLLFKIIPHDSDADFVSPASRDRGWSYDKIDVRMGLDQKLDFIIPSNINAINKLELLLYNKEGYAGIVGKKIIIKNKQ